MSTDQPKYLWGKLNPRYTGPQAATKMDHDVATRSAASQDFAPSPLSDEDMDLAEAAAEMAGSDMYQWDKKISDRLSGVDGLSCFSISNSDGDSFDSLKDLSADMEDKLAEEIERYYQENPDENIGDYHNTDVPFVLGTKVVDGYSVNLNYDTEDPIYNMAVYDSLSDREKDFVIDHSDATGIHGTSTDQSIDLQSILDDNSLCGDIVNTAQSSENGDLVTDYEYERAAYTIAEDLCDDRIAVREMSLAMADNDVSDQQYELPDVTDDELSDITDDIAEDYENRILTTNNMSMYAARSLMESDDPQDYIRNFHSDGYFGDVALATLEDSDPVITAEEALRDRRGDW